jgi:outer membrane protein assembly complex protein YaeT
VVRRSVRLLGSIVGLLIVFALIAVHTRPARRFVTDRLTAVLARQQISFSAEPIRYNLFDASVTLQNARIGSATWRDGPVFATIGRARIDLSLFQLLRGRYVIQSGTVEDVEVHYVQGDQGHDNLPRPPREADTQSGRLDYFVSSLSIARARVHYENRTGGVDARLPLDSIDVTGNDVTQRHQIRIHASGGAVRVRDRQTPIRRLQCDASIGRDDASIKVLAVETGGSHIEVTGTIKPFDAPVVDLKIASRVDATEASSVAGVDEPVTGTLAIDAAATGPLSAAVVTARLSGSPLQFRDLHVQVDATATYDRAENAAEVSSLEARAPWGAVSARGRMAFDESGQSGLTATITNVDAAALMRSLHLPWAAATEVNGILQAEWQGLDYRAAAGNAEAVLRSTTSETAKSAMPVSGRIVARGEGGRIDAQLFELGVPGGEANGRVELTLDRQIRGQVTAQSADIRELVASVETLIGHAEGSLFRVPIAGQVDIDAQLAGTVDAPVATVTLTAPALEVGVASGIALDADAVYTDGTVTIKRGELNWHEARVQLDGRIGIGRNQPIAIVFAAHALSVESLLEALNRPEVAITGTLTASGTVRGTTARPTVSIAANGTNLVAYGEALGSATLRAQLDGRHLTLSNLVVEKPQPGQSGRLMASGTYDFGRHAYTVDLRSEDLRLLNVVLPGEQRLRGHVERLRASGSGSIDAPEGSVDLDITALEIEASGGVTPLGRLVINGVAKNGEATINAAAERFNLDSRAVVGLTAPWPATITLRASDLDLASLPLHTLLETTAAKVAGLHGTLRTSVDASGDLLDPARGRATVVLESLSGSWNGRPFAVTTTAPLRYDRERIAIDGFRVEGLDTSLTISGDLPLGDQTAAGQLTVDLRGSLATLTQYAPRDTQLSADGSVTLTGTLRGTLTRIEPDLVLTVEDGLAFSPVLHPGFSNVALRAHFNNGTADIKELSANWGTATLQLSGRVPLDVIPHLPVSVPHATEPARLLAVINGLDPSSIPLLPAGLRGRISAEADLTAAHPNLDALTGRISFQEFDLAFGALALSQQQPMTIAVASGEATLAQSTLSGSAGTITAGGRIELDGERALDLSVDGTINIAALSILTDQIRTEGDSTVKLLARGTVAAPDLTGTVTLTDGTAVFDQPRVAAENINAHFDLANRRMSVTRFDADVNGGTVTASGSVTLGERLVSDVNLEMSAKDVAFDEPLGLRSISNASLTLSQAGDTIVVKGKLTIEEAGLTDDVNLDVGLLGRIAARGNRSLTPDRNPLLDRLRFDVDVTSATPVLVDNNLARAEMTAALHVVGSPYQPALLGSLTLLEDSEILLNERRYQVERGVITFADERRILPSFDLRLNTRASDYDVTVSVTGAIGNTETNLTSTPSLPEPDIMSLLVTGRTLDDMRGEGLDVAREQVLSTLAGRVGSTLGRGLRQATGFSEVRIEPILIANEADPSARLTVGQNLTNNTKIVYSTNLADSNDQIWVLEYDLTRRFQARAVWQEDDTARFDFRRDLRFGGAPESVSRERVRPTVREVSVTVDQGNEATVRDKFGIRVGQEYDFFTIRNGIQRVTEWLIDQGYLQSRVRLERRVDGQAAHLRLLVVTGPHVEMAVKGASPPGRIERELREQWQRGAFDQQREDDGSETLREWLMSDSHLQAKIETTIDEMSERQRRVIFHVDPGPRSRRILLMFDGASTIHPDALDRIVREQKLEQRLFTDPSVVIDLLERYYQVRGYLAADIEEPRFEFEGETARIVLPIDEGPRFTVGAIAASGNTVFATDVLSSKLPFVTGAPFVPALAENAVAQIRDLYWAKGYNEAHVDYELVTSRVDGEADVTFTIVEGQQSVIADVAIAGNERVSNRLVRGQIQLSPNEPLDLNALARSRRNLYSTGAFSFVDITRRELQDADDDAQRQVHLDVTLKEVPPFQLRYGASYDTERGIGGILDLTNRNSLGGARELGIRSRYDGQVTDVRIFLNQPELTRRSETTVSLYFREELNPPTELTDSFDTSRKGASIQQQRRLRNRNAWTYGYKYERTHTLTPTPTGTLDDAVTVSPLTSTLTRETRDTVLDATRGSFLSQGLSFSPRWLGSDQPYLKYFGQYFHYFPLQAQRQNPVTGAVIRPRLVYATGVRLGLAWGLGGDVPRIERFFAGGSATLRGFEQNTVGPITAERFALGGQGLLVLNNELRVPLISVFDGVLFTDIGNVFATVPDFSLTNLRQSVGAGLRIRTAWVLLRGDYGYVIDPRPGEPRSRFYFSIGQAF